MLPALALVAMVLLAGTSERTGRPGAIMLACAALIWFLTNSPMEGRVLLVVSTTHGLTAADLAGLAALGLAAWRWRAAVVRTAVEGPTGSTDAVPVDEVQRPA